MYNPFFDCPLMAATHLDAGADQRVHNDNSIPLLPCVGSYLFAVDENRLLATSSGLQLASYPSAEQLQRVLQDEVRSTFIKLTKGIKSGLRFDLNSFHGGPISVRQVHCNHEVWCLFIWNKLSDLERYSGPGYKGIIKSTVYTAYLATQKRLSEFIGTNCMTRSHKTGSRSFIAPRAYTIVNWSAEQPVLVGGKYNMLAIKKFQWVAVLD